MAKRIRARISKKKKIVEKKLSKPHTTDRERSTSVERDHTRGRERRMSTESETHRRPHHLGLMNRNIFNEPFFTDPWEDLFNFPSVDKMMSTARDMTKKAIKSVTDMERATPREGSKYSRSFYRTSSNVDGDTKGELISQETATNYDEQGRKFTEKKKTYENVKDRIIKTTESKMIDDRGIKHMKTRHLDTGEEYEHNEYKHMNEKDLTKFNEDFRKGIKGGLAAHRALGTETSFPALASVSSLDMDRDRFGFAVPGMMNYGLYGSPWDRFGMMRDMMKGFGDFDRIGSMFDRDRLGFGDFGRLGYRDRDYGIGTPTSVSDQDRNFSGKRGITHESKIGQRGKSESQSVDQGTTSRRR